MENIFLYCIAKLPGFKRLSGALHELYIVICSKAAADQMWASSLPKEDYYIEVTCTTVTSGENLHVWLDMLIKFPH